MIAPSENNQKNFINKKPECQLNLEYVYGFNIF